MAQMPPRPMQPMQDPSEVSFHEFDDVDVDRLLVAVINNTAFANKLAPWLEADALEQFTGAKPWQIAIWETLRDILIDGEHRDSVHPRYLARYVEDTALRRYGDPEQAQLAKQAVLEIDGIQPLIEASIGLIEYLHSKCVMGPEIAALLNELKGTSEWEKVAERVERLKGIRSKDVGGDPEDEQIDPFSALDRLDKPPSQAELDAQNPRITTGVPYIDAIHATKGIYRGFLTLILGPTGGGKTIVSSELAASMSSKGMSVGMFGTEENAAISLEARARLWASCTSIPTSVWIDASCEPALLPEEHRLDEAQLENLRSMRDFVSIYNLEPVTWSAIVTKLDMYFTKHGKMHDLVIIDWAGPLAKDMIAAKEATAMHEALELICINAYQQIARRYNCAVVIFHQLSDEAVKKKSIFGAYSEGDSQNCHKMAQHCAAVHVISPRDGNNVCRYIGAKMRFDPKGVQTVIRMDYEHTRFNHHADKEVRGRTFVSKDGPAKDGSSRMMGKKGHGASVKAQS